jgi:hypothetical protein
MPDLTSPPSRRSSILPGVPYGVLAGLSRPFTSAFVVPYFKQDADGLSAPSLEMRHIGAFRICWPVNVGSREFTIWCRHSGHTPRPRVRIAANPELGVNSDVYAEAQDTLDWHLIRISVTTTAAGVLEVYLELRALGAWVRWDSADVS